MKLEPRPDWHRRLFQLLRSEPPLRTWMDRQVLYNKIAREMYGQRLLSFEEHQEVMRILDQHEQGTNT